MSDLHVHFHGDVSAGATLVIQVPATGALAAQLNQLKEIITMNHAETEQALKDANESLELSNAKLDAIGAQIDKGVNEVILALQNNDTVPQSVVDQLTRLKDNVAKTKAATDSDAVKSQTLDDLNPDAPQA